MRKLLFTCVVLFVLLCSFQSGSILLTNDVVIEDFIPSNQAFTTHDPMVIRSNADFVKEGWTGDGSSDRPYTISFLEFTSQIDGACINISDTTAYFVITNCLFDTVDFACAINLQNVMNGRIQYCTTGNNIWGIRIRESFIIELEYLTLHACIIMEYSGLCNVSHCSISGAPGDGVSLWGCIAVLVKACDITYCTANGIWLETTFSSSLIGNTLQGNDMYQIDITGGSFDNTIYNNMIYYYSGGSGIARDNGLVNNWDDNVSIGNWWSNYGGTGNYSISGSAGSVDRYPMGHTSVVLVNHEDVQFEMGSVSSILWDAFSEVPDYFLIYRNGEIIDSGVWDGSDVSTSVLTDTLGLYNYTLFVNGTSSDNKTDTAMVTISVTAPYIDSPSDITYQYGQTENSIVWHPTSSNPERYEIYRDDGLISNETWDGSTVSYSVDDLSIGIYSFRLRVVDIIGNDANDTVQVTVIEATATTTTTTTTNSGLAVDTTLLLVIGIVGALIVVLVLVSKFGK